MMARWKELEGEKPSRRREMTQKAVIDKGVSIFPVLLDVQYQRNLLPLSD